MRHSQLPLPLPLLLSIPLPLQSTLSLSGQACLPACLPCVRRDIDPMIIAVEPRKVRPRMTGAVITATSRHGVARNFR
jgi:hypothetical protein